MRVNIKFKTEMMKNGKLNEVGDEIEVDATSAILLAEKGDVEIPGYDIIEEEKTIIVKTLVATENE